MPCKLRCWPRAAAPVLRSICAALLHDIGHLLHELPDEAPEQGIDDVHERLGYNFLRRSFVPEVAEPVRLHVAAKRDSVRDRR